MSSNSNGASCDGITCSYASCAPGYADCNASSPPDLDGCETSTTNNTNACGACGRACSTAGVATLLCSGGACNSSCQSGFGNCSMPTGSAPDDGCESNLTTCVGTPCCGTLCTGLHQNGLGQTYPDCAPFGVPGNQSTYTVNMADEADNAWPGGGSQGDGTCGADDCVYQDTGFQCAVWCYDGATAGHVYLATGPGPCGSGCCCPTTSSPTWN
jgi:hypothetical protein